jgi:hypothetical protein
LPKNIRRREGESQIFLIWSSVWSFIWNYECCRGNPPKADGYPARKDRHRGLPLQKHEKQRGFLLCFFIKNKQNTPLFYSGDECY